MHTYGSIIIEKIRKSLQKSFSKHFEMKYITSHCRHYYNVSAAQTVHCGLTSLCRIRLKIFVFLYHTASADMIMQSHFIPEQFTAWGSQA